MKEQTIKDFIAKKRLMSRFAPNEIKNWCRVQTFLDKDNAIGYEEAILEIESLYSIQAHEPIQNKTLDI